MTGQSAEAIPTAAAGNIPQGEATVPPLLSGRLMDILVKSIIRKARSMPRVLSTWEPSMEGSARFLQLLTEKMPLEWWKGRTTTVRGQILDELIRIDNGRGIIADWLASIIREENDISVLETAAGWESRKYTFTDRLLDAWRDRSLDHSSNVHAIRETALKVMVNAILPSGTSSGNAGSENAGRSAWNEERRAETVRQCLSETLNAGHALGSPEIIAQWHPSPELHGKEVLSGIFCEWERHVQNAAGVVAKNGKRPHGNRCDIQQEYLQMMTGKVLLNLSPYCVDMAGRLLSWMEYRLERGIQIAPELENKIARWDPPDDALREEVMALWSRYLLSPHGYKNPWVWTAVGRYFSGCRQPGPKADEIVRNVLGALRLVTKIHGRAKAPVMEAVVCPPWLTSKQQAEWKKLWDGLMKSPSGKVVQVATRHLLGLVTSGLADPDNVKKTILKRLENLDANTAATIISGLMHEMGQWEVHRDSPGEMFHEVWVKLRQCPWWKDVRVRRDAAKALAVCLKTNLGLGKVVPRLESLWLESLHMERNPVVIQALLEGQSEIMKICPGFCPDSIQAWKKLGQDESPEVRKITWRFFISLGDRLEDGMGMFLVERLRDEKSLDVLRVMAGWKPLTGKPLPPGFREGWRDALQVFTSRLQESSLQSRLGEMVLLEKCIIRSFMTSWLEEQLSLNGQSSRLADLRMFREMMAEMMKSIPVGEGEIIRQIERIQKHMEALLRLDEPPERFLDSFTGLNVCEKDFHVWRYLIESLEGRDVKTIAVNARHNLGVVSASLLARNNNVSNRTHGVFMELCGDGTWTPDRIPAGWEEFCREFCRICMESGWAGYPSDDEMERICMMVRMGHAMGDERCHQLFRQTLCQVLKRANPFSASFVESILWHEVIRAAQMAERLAPDGKGLDEAGQRRWLRQFILAHGRAPGEDKSSETTGGYWNSLWTGLYSGSSPQETAGGRRKYRVKALAMYEAMYDRALVFFHPHRDANRGDRQCDRLIETDTRQGQHPVLFPAGQTCRSPNEPAPAHWKQREIR